MPPMNRRDWIKASSLAASAGLLLGRDAEAMPLISETEAAQRYPARRAEGAIRLCFNENPYGPSLIARNEMVKYWSEASLYTGAGVAALRDVVAADWGVAKEHILITQGSSEGLDAVGAAFSIAGGEVVCAEPTFDALMNYSRTFGAAIVRVPVDANLVHDLPAIEAKIGPKTRLVFICNPNNPTGTIVGGTELKAFCERVSKKVPILVDEAYHDFVDDPNFSSMIPLIAAGHDVIISRTSSKIHGMAGMRVGFLMARPELLERIRKFTMGQPNAMAVRAVAASVQDKAYQAYIKQQNKKGREIAYAAIEGCGLRAVRSQGNFVFFKTGRPANEVAKAFEARGILVGRAFPPMLDWCRVSTGTPEEMEKFASALKAVVA